MKTKSKSASNRQPEGNRKYSIGIPSKDGIPTVTSIWLNEVTGFRRQPHMLGIDCIGRATLWVRDNDSGAQELVKDWNRMRERYKQQQKLYSKYLQEQQHKK